MKDKAEHQNEKV